MTAVTGAVPALAAYSGARLLDELARGAAAEPARAVRLALSTVTLGALATAAGYLSGLLSSVVQQAVTCLAEGRLYSHVNRFVGVRYLEDSVFHDRLLLAEHAVESAPSDVMVFLVGLVQQLANVGAYVAVLIALWPPMAVLIAAAALPALLAQLVLSRQATLAATTAVLGQRWRYYYRSLLTDPDAAKEIRLFGLGPLFYGRMMKVLRAALAVELRQNRRTTATEIGFSALNSALSGLGVVVVVRAVLSGRLTIGDLSLFLAAVASVQGAFSTVISQFGRAIASLRLFSSYLDVLETPSDLAEGTKTVPQLSVGVEFDDVWFRYNKDSPWVLQGVSFVIPAGRDVGLVGVNGAGKSTLVKLLLRMYEPEHGRITWDGVDLKELATAQVRQRVRAAFQDHVAYDLTAGENIGIGDVDHLGDTDKIRVAARLAEVDGVLSALPRGYQTLLSRMFSDDAQEPGTTLSGGQWQRVALARSLVRSGADLLVLDEPSAGLDAEAEHQVHQTLVRHRRGRASLLISHRLNAIRDADEILVLDAGRITERGAHDELIAAGGDYARLFKLQATGYRDEEVPYDSAY